jgi:hypothetical protein
MGRLFRFKAGVPSLHFVANFTVLITPGDLQGKDA